MATDARRKEVYWARYEASPSPGDAARLTEPAVDRPADIADQVAGVPAVGAGALLYDTVFTGVRREAPSTSPPGRWPHWPPGSWPRARSCRRPQPMYLRRPDAQVPANYKVVTPQ